MNCNKIMILGLLVASMVARADEQLHSFVTASSFTPPEIVQFLRDQRSNPEFCDAVTFTMRIKGNEVDDVSVLEPVVLTIFRLVWQLQHSKSDDMRWLDEIGSPIKETVELCGGSGSVHGNLNVSLEEFDTITLTLSVHREEKHDDKIWADIIARCTNLVARCAESSPLECKEIITSGFGKTLGTIMDMVNEQTKIRAEFEMKFSDKDANKICLGYTT